MEELLRRQSEREQQIIEIEAAANRVAEILLLQQNYACGPRESCSQVDCNEIIDDALKVLEGSFVKRKIDLKKDLESPAPALFLDKDRLLQIFVILLKNSFEAIDKKFDVGLNDGGEKVVKLASRVENSELRISLSDSGIGLNTDELDKLFTFGHSGKGASGFGLYYCKQWIEKNKGRITMTSSGPGSGARVEICLPLNRKECDVSDQDNSDC